MKCIRLNESYIKYTYVNKDIYKRLYLKKENIHLNSYEEVSSFQGFCQPFSHNSKNNPDVRH